MELMSDNVVQPENVADTDQMQVRDYYNYTTENFESFGRQKLMQMRSELGCEMFKHTFVKNGKKVRKIMPFLISAYVRIVFYIKTIKPEKHFYKGDMYYYDTAREIYVPIAETKVAMKMNEWLGDEFQYVNMNQVLEKLRASTYVDRDALALDINLIPVKNCMIKLANSNWVWDYTIVANSPEYFVVNRMPISFTYKDRNMLCTSPPILTALRKNLPNKETEITWIQEYLGGCLYRKFLYKKAMIWAGAGDNGKTAYMTVITRFLGAENTTETSLQYMCNERWGTAEFYNKLCNLKDDLSSDDLEHLGKFKEITGGAERVRAEMKFADTFSYYPYCKHIFACNRIPFANEPDEAFYERWFIVEWLQKYRHGDPRRNEYLADELSTPENLQMMFEWALSGLLRILTNRGFTDPPLWENNKIKWEALGNPCTSFIQNPTYVTIDPDGLYPIKDFNNDLYNYCIMYDLPTYDQNGIHVGRIIAKNYKDIITRTYTGSQGNQIHYYKGIMPTKPEPPEKRGENDSPQQTNLVKEFG